MSPEPVDLSPLALSPQRRERLAAAVLAHARIGFVPRSPLVELAGWARPTLAAAAVIAALSVGSLAWITRPSTPQRLPMTVADGLRIPDPVGEWVVEDRAPEEEDLMAQWDEAMSGGRLPSERRGGRP